MFPRATRLNHSCDPNVQSFTLTGQVDSITYHSIGLFTFNKIFAGEELCLDYQWDKNDLTIAELGYAISNLRGGKAAVPCTMI